MEEYHTVISVVLWHSFHFPKLNWCYLKGIVQHAPVMLTADWEFLQSWCQHLQRAVVVEVQLCFLKQILGQYPQGVSSALQLPMWSFATLQMQGPHVTIFGSEESRWSPGLFFFFF